MLNYFLTVLQQIFSMFLMIMVGFIMFRMKLITAGGIKDMSALLLKIVMPMIVIASFQRQFEAGLFTEWCIMLGTSLLTYIISIIIAELFYRRKGIRALAESKLGVVLPNCGFLAFPLMQALAGENGIFMGSTSVILLNILQWTYGSKLIDSSEKISVRKMFLNPGTISIIASLALFISPWKLPQPIFNAVDAIGSLNTPLAMIVLGGMLAQTDIKAALSKLCYYKISFLKLILIPVIMMFVLKLLPLSGIVRLVAFICSVVPTATSVSMLSQLYDSDYRYATNVVVITTVLSVVTMPILLTIGKFILGY